jgi:hypothetical protein
MQKGWRAWGPRGRQEGAWVRHRGWALGVLWRAPRAARVLARARPRGLLCRHTAIPHAHTQAYTQNLPPTPLRLRNVGG